MKEKESDRTTGKSEREREKQRSIVREREQSESVRNNFKIQEIIKRDGKLAQYIRTIACIGSLANTHDTSLCTARSN